MKIEIACQESNIEENNSNVTAKGDKKNIIDDKKVDKYEDLLDSGKIGDAKNKKASENRTDHYVSINGTSSCKTIDPQQGFRIIEKFYCILCREGFDSAFDLVKHSVLNYKKKNHMFFCRNCFGQEFATLFDFRKHINKCKKFDEAERMYFKINPEFTKYYCEFCSKGFACHIDFRKHKKECHLLERANCPICSESFDDADPLICHIQRHSLIGNVDLTCKHCSLHFYAPLVYSVHLVKVHLVRKSNKIYQCCLCPKKYVGSIQEFVMHVTTHDILHSEVFDGNKIVMKNGRPLLNMTKRTCPICSKLFFLEDACTDHKLRAHRQSKSETQIETQQSLPNLTTCLNNSTIVTERNCGNKQENAEQLPFILDKIQLPSSESQQIKLPCLKCKIIIPVQEFESHQASHKNDLEIKCTECSMSFDTVENLINHMKALHFSIGAVAPTQMYQFPMEMQMNPGFVSTQYFGYPGMNQAILDSQFPNVLMNNLQTNCVQYNWNQMNYPIMTNQIIQLQPPLPTGAEPPPPPPPVNAGIEKSVQSNSLECTKTIKSVDKPCSTAPGKFEWSITRDIRNRGPGSSQYSKDNKETQSTLKFDLSSERTRSRKCDKWSNESPERFSRFHAREGSYEHRNSFKSSRIRKSFENPNEPGTYFRRDRIFNRSSSSESDTFYRRRRSRERERLSESKRYVTRRGPRTPSPEPY